MRFLFRLIWSQPWGPPLLLIIGIATVVGIVWYNIQESKVKEEERRRDRAKGDSIWDD